MRQTSPFLNHALHDLKYLGINTMATLLRIQPDTVVDAEVQSVIIDCLIDEDETLKRKTLDLLCHITNSSNVEVVCEKLLSFLRSTNDTFFREGLVTKITELAEKFAPDTVWYLNVMNEVFELGGSLVRDEVAHNLMRLIAEGLDDEAEDNKLRHDAVISYLNLLYKPSLPDLLIKLICWVVSEYAYLAEENEPGEIIERVSGLLNRRLEDPQTCGWVISAVGKLAAQLGYLPDNVKQLLVCQCRTVSVDVRQRCHEILELNSDMTLMREVLPLDASCEEIEVDGGLSFLDELVSASLRQGMEAYTPKSLRNSCNLKEIEMEVSTPNFRFEPYEKPTLPMPKVHRESHTITLSSSTVTPPGDVSAIPPEQTISQPNSSVSAPSTLSQRITNQLETKGNKTWSRDGYLSKDVRSGRTDSVFKTQSQSSNYKTQGDILTTEKAIQNQQLKEPTAEDLRKRNLAQALFGGAANSKIQQGIMKAKKQDKNKQTHGLNILSDNTSVASTASAESGRNSSFSSQAGQNDSFSSGQGTNFTADKTADLLSKIDDDVTNVSTRQGTDLTVHEHGNDFDQGIPQELDIRGDLLLLDLDGPVVKTDLSENNEIDIKQTDSFNKAVSINGEEIGNNLLENKAGSQTNVPSLLDSDISDNSSTVTTNMETSTSLPADLLAFPHSSDHQELCNDGTIRVTVQRVWSPRELVLALFITNQHNIEAISDVSVRVEPSSNLILSQAHQSLITEEKIHSSQSKIHIVEIKLKSPSLNTKLTGQVSYKDSTKTLKRTFFQSHTINISDFIRPLQLNTEEFGAKWTSTSNDKKDKIQSNLVSCQEFMDKAANILHLHAVQIIGCEGIAVGTILQSGICLLHGKIENGFVSLWVKSNSQLLTEAVLKQTINIFKL